MCCLYKGSAFNIISSALKWFHGYLELFMAQFFLSWEIVTAFWKVEIEIIFTSMFNIYCYLSFARFTHIIKQTNIYTHTHNNNIVRILWWFSDMRRYITSQVSVQAIDIESIIHYGEQKCSDYVLVHLVTCERYKKALEGVRSDCANSSSQFCGYEIYLKTAKYKILYFAVIR